MTSLVLGAVGAVIGGIIGGPVGAQIGWLAGSLIGSLIDPPKVQGPRLGDLKLQTATYGKFIPFFWGTGRIGGNIIDQTDLEEHKQKSGGKGGPEITNFTYTASFDIMLGAARVFGEPAIKGVNRIWADGRLFWAADDGSACPFTIYDGSETQLPDPTFEAIHGVGEVPAYRGYAHAVATDLLLTDFGNRIPAFEFEVYTSAGDYPFWVAHGAPWTATGTVPSFMLNDDGDMVVVRTQGAPNVNVYYQVFDVNTLVQIGSTVLSVTAGGQFGNAINSLTFPTLQAPATIQWAAPDPSGVYFDGADVSSTADFFPGKFGGNLAVAQGGYYFSTDGLSTTSINKYATGSSFVGSVSLGSYTANDTTLGHDPLENKIYVIFNGSGPGLAEMWRLDIDLNIEKHWTHAELIGTRLVNGVGNNFVVYRGQVCFQYHSGATYYAALVNIGSGDVLVDAAQPLFTLDASGRFGYLGNGMIVCQGGGIFSLNSPPSSAVLSDIVSDLSDMTPALGAYNVTELTDAVRWFVIGSQMTVRNALQVLRQAFFFDAVESDDLIKFRKRSMTSTFSIPDGDLCARDYGEPSGEPLRTIRKKEQDLPRTVTMNYIDVDTDYQMGSQQAVRQTALSQQDVTVDVPVGLTIDEAIQKATTLLVAEWIERESFEWSTSRKWAKLEPCDVGLVRGRVIRIQTRTESPNGVIKWTGVLAAPSTYTTAASNIYIQPATGSPGDGWVDPDPPGPKADTRLILLDLPLVVDSDAAVGHYAAISPLAAGSWAGGAVYKSIDGGSTYSSVGEGFTSDVVGSVAAALGNYTGGNSFDEKNVITVVITSAGGELVSSSEAAVLNGANVCAIGTATAGWEILQFKTATLIATDTYKLSGLLRGRRGTEWKMAAHGVNETFVLLPTTLNIVAPTGELGASRKYKGVTFGKAVVDAIPMDFTNTGIAAKPYAPLHVEAGRDAAGNITLQWIRRTRIGGTWLQGAEVPVGEGTEYYRVFIYSNGTYATLVRQLYSTIQTAAYSAAQQTADFGSPQATLYVDVMQGGLYGDGYKTRGAL